MIDDLYPPTIQGAPPELTRPSSQYRRQVNVVMACLVVFLLFYFGMIVGSVFVISQAVYAEMPGMTDNQGQPYINESGEQFGRYARLAEAAVATVLLIFLVKALFKWKKQKDETRIEITEAEHPALFQFIRRICEDTHAPFPEHIFLTPEVNASVMFNSPLRSLVSSDQKNLVIGLGLVNGLDLSEFKAVLAHEFGHFSQSSMQLGSYVYTLNRVIYDIVFHRDGFDEVLSAARRSDVRIAIFAHLMTFLLWLLRKILQMAFRVINFYERALSRQMEFHADLVAVSITGSDALIHALKKLDFISACLEQTMADLKEASIHNIYTPDLFYHQTHAAEHIRREADREDIGVVPELPQDPSQRVDVFTKEDGSDEQEGMWASHPPHYDREQNAKQHYLRSPQDTRSPWLLFSRPEELRQKMTALVYQHVLEVPVPPHVSTPEQVQEFIEAEHQETHQDPRYAGMYDGRLLSLDSDLLTQYANDPALTEYSQAHIQEMLEKQQSSSLKDWIEAYHKRREEHSELEAVASGDVKLKGKVFEFRGAEHPKSEAKALAESVERELDADVEWLKNFDRDVFQSYLRMAQQIGDGDRDLYDRYYFHLHLQAMLKIVRLQGFRMQRLFQFLASKGDGLTMADRKAVIPMLVEIHTNVATGLHDHGAAPLPSLQNMLPGAPLAICLLEGPLIGALPPDIKHIDRKWSQALMSQIVQMEERGRRLYFKSMGSILARQEAIASQWLAQNGIQSPQSPNPHHLQAGTPLP